MNKQQIEEALKALEDMTHSQLASHYRELLLNKLKEIENDRRQEGRN